MQARRFSWDEAGEVLAELLSAHLLELGPGSHQLRGEKIEVQLPLVLPWPGHAASLERYRASLPDELGLQLIVLMQAGATSLGLFEGGQSLETKTIKKYVVRGTGRAQPTHLKSRGKSRYGSRLRLQNARSILLETNDYLRSWIGLYGKPEQLLYNCPLRLWSSLFEAAAKPPIPRNADWTRIPRDLPVPTTALMLRTYDQLCFGRVERRPNE
jgi:hypothetical protein